MELAKLNFACVYYGDKYKIEYVEKLYNMVQRHTTLPHNFICFTDSTIIQRRLKRTLPGHKIIFRQFHRHDFKGWFNKLQLFSPEAELIGNTLYMDLDIVILDNIDCFFTCGKDHNFVGMNDFNPTSGQFNSSIMKFNNETTTDSNGHVNSIYKATVTTADDVPLNQWVHLYAEVTGNSAKIYMNGVLQGTVSSSQSIRYSTIDDNFGIGATVYDSSRSRPFNGSIDQVRIFNRALTSTEVTTLYNKDATKYTADITALGLANPPTKAWLDKPIAVSTVTEATEARAIAQDETLDFVSSTTSEYVGTNAISGLLTAGDSIQIDGTTDVVCSNVVETDLGGGSYQYACTIPTQASAPTSAKVLDRSITTTEDTDIYDNVNDKFVKTYNKVIQTGRAFKYKIEADTDVQVDKITIPMNRQIGS